MKEDFYRVIFENEEFKDVTLEEIEELDIVKNQDGTYHLLFDNASYNMEVVDFDMPSGRLRVSLEGKLYDVNVKDSIRVKVDELGLSSIHQSAEEFIVAPMPGLVLDVLVSAGQEVQKGETLLILEAMKMENVIAAPHDAHIEEVYVTNGKSVDKAEQLVKLT